MPRLLIILPLLLAPTTARAQDPLPKVPPGFRIELIAKAPDIEAPTALAVAPNGDLYFAEDPMDMRGPSNKNFDKIWMFKGGDPKQRILIADKLWAVMGMELVADKLFVVHYPFISVFTLDADGKATRREDLFTDCGPKSAPPGGFNDHVPSGIRMGIDGYLYVSIGDKGVPKMTRHAKDPLTDGIEVAEGRVRNTPGGKFISLEGGGVIRFRPDGSRLEVFASGTRNHLDVPMDEQDRIFVRDNTDDGDGWHTRLMYIARDGFYGYPWAFTKQPRETLPMVRDFGGGSPCGGWVYCDDGLPETYRGRVFHCEWGKGKVLAVKLQRDGAGFKFVDEIPFVDPTGTGVKDFRPYSLRPTADGKGFYITDWGFSGWSQKPVAGRIYKVTYVKDDVKPAPRFQEGDSAESMAKALNHPAHSERMRIQHRLVNRLATPDKRVSFAKVSQELMADPKTTPAAKRHLMWATLRGLSEKNALKLAVDNAADPDATVRAEAARVVGAVLGETRVLTSGMRKFASASLHAWRKDADAQVRLQALLVSHLAVFGVEFGEPGIAAAASARVLAQSVLAEPEQDPFLQFAQFKLLRQLSARNPRFYLADMLSKKLEPAQQALILLALADSYQEREVARLHDLLPKLESAALRKQVIGVLGRMHQDRKPYAGGWWGTRPEQQKPPARVVAWEGTPKVRDALLSALSDQDVAVRQAAVDGILAMNDPQTLDPLVQRFLLAKVEDEQRLLLRAIGGLKQQAGVELLGKVALKEAHAESVRLEAIARLELAGGAQAVKVLGDVFDLSDSAALQARAIEGLGNLKAKAERPTLEKSLNHSAAVVRQRGVAALGKLADVSVVALLLPRLEDKDAGVRETTVRVLGDLKAPAAVPALVQATANAELQFDAITALAKIPDVRAIPAYLTGLQSKNATLRQACRTALTVIHAQAAPVLEELAKRNELQAEVLPELRTVFTAYAPILAWKLIGPFPNDDKAHPPQTELKFDAGYKGVAKDVKWSDRKGNAAQQGKVDLLKIYSPNAEVVAYGYAEVDSDSDRAAQLQVGSDDSIVIWLNGQKVHEHLGDRAWKFDADKVKITLKKGKNTLLVKCGQKGGDWAFSVAVSGSTNQYAFLQGGPKKLDLGTFRAFAAAKAGDAARGGKLFTDLKGLACAKCHAVAGQGGKVGPDLAGIALRYKKDDLITSILEPSKQMANGYETQVITTTAGTVVTGILKGDDGDHVTLLDADAKEHRIAKKDIDTQRISPISTMPNGLSDGMTLQDFADLIAYLEARREELKAPR